MASKILNGDKKIGPAALLLAISTLWLSGQAQAREIIGYRTVYVSASSLQQTPAEPEADTEVDAPVVKRPRTEVVVKQNPINSALRLIVNGQVYQSRYRTSIPTMSQAYQSACSGRLDSRSVCHDWPTLKKSFEAAAMVMNIPAPALVCLMKAESNLVPGRTSSANARGLTQFIPSTAQYFQSRMFPKYPRKGNPYTKYQANWEKYRRYQGTYRPVTAFTAQNIRSASPSMADVQIFATAMYFKDALDDGSDTIRRVLGAPPEPNKAGLRHMMHYLLVSYNAGGVPGQAFLQSGGRMRLSNETRRYLGVFDACMNKAATY